MVQKLRRRGDALIVIDYQDRRPLYEQITDKFKNLILQGALEPESRMPSVRQLAVDLSINPNTIQRAYAQLEQMGLIYPVKGRGNFVCPNEKLIRRKMAQYRAELKEEMIRGAQRGISQDEMNAMIREVFEDRRG